jgi:hypothetical protein
VLAPVGSDPFAWNEAVSEILKYSLLRRDPKTVTLEIHRLVQAVLKCGMDEAVQRRWAERAVRAIDCAVPEVEFSTWALCDRLLPQAQACAELIEERDFDFPEAARLLSWAIRTPSLSISARWRSGKRLWSRSIPPWPPASTIWRSFSGPKVNTGRPSPFTNGRW